MPRTGTIPADIADFLSRKHNGASTEEIRDALAKVRRSPVLAHSVRSALYQHLDQNGEKLFVRLGRGRYGLRERG
jgi:hypothetical protein